MSRMNDCLSRGFTGKPGSCIMYKVRSNIKKYQTFKKIAFMQNRDLAESTDRYIPSMRWYELIRIVLESWRDTYPDDAAIIMDLYALGDRKQPMTATNVSLKHHVSTSTVYSIANNFTLEVAFKAVQSGLLHV